MTQQPVMGQQPMTQPVMGQQPMTQPVMGCLYKTPHGVSANKASSVILKTSFVHLLRFEQVGFLERGFAVQNHC
jgi:hypothetical protein